MPTGVFTGQTPFSSGAGGTGCCEPLDMNAGIPLEDLEEQQVLLSAELPLQPQMLALSLLFPSSLLLCSSLFSS